MRLFIAVDIPEEIISALDKLIARLKPSARIGWCRPESLHITTKFIGEWPDARLAEIEKALRSVPRQDPMPIQIRETGFFPNAKSPRVFWVGVEAPPGLAALARDTDQVLKPLGIEPEKRPYSPHLTLARIKEPLPLDGLRRAIAEIPSPEFGSFTADRFFLYHSKLSPTGSVYTKLSEFRFGS